MKKIDIKDLTFLIPIRLDSIIRLENLLATIQSIQKDFNTNIMVLEASSVNNRILKRLLRKNIDYIFVEDKDPIFYRTRYLNLMTKRSLTPYIGIWDADVIIDKKQIVESILQLRSDKADITYPFNGPFRDTTAILRKLYLKIIFRVYIETNKRWILYMALQNM